MLVMPGTGGTSTALGGSLGLSPERLRTSRHRVGNVALIVAVMMVLGSPIQVGLHLAGVLTRNQLIENLSGAVLMASLSLLVLGIVKSARVSDAPVVWIGIVFQVLFCMGTAYGTHLVLFLRVGEPAFMTWVTPNIILFPLLIPIGPRVAVWVGLVCAATEPLSLALLAHTEGLALEMGYLAVLTNPLVAVGVAWYASRTLNRLSRDVARARRLGSYQLVERLGEGGMGEVWRAEHALLARPAAIKLVRSGALGETAGADELLQRFEQEAQATASLRSPHTVHLYDFGRSDDGAFYIVMELLEGMTLESLVEQFGPQPASRVAHMLGQVCHSLAEAHEAGLVHRDVKPANLFVCRYGRDDDFVKVLDFGLVKSSVGPVEAGVTNVGMVPGTPAYLAPEALLGQPVDGRADLYALGCVAYFLLTGTIVFDGATAVAVVAKHISDPPSPPSSRTELPIPEALERIVLACLAKSPDDRPASAARLAEQLAAADLPAWTPEDAGRWWSSHRPG